MQFKFEHKADLEPKQRYKLLQDGIGKFWIKEVRQYDENGQILRTKKGDPKFVVQLSVIDQLGNKGFVYEHITAKLGWKLGTMLQAIGKGELYTEEGNVDPRHLVNGDGKCVLETRADPGYPRSTGISKYLPAAQSVPITELPPEEMPDTPKAGGFGDDKTEDFFDDIIPF